MKFKVNDIITKVLHAHPYEVVLKVLEVQEYHYYTKRILLPSQRLGLNHKEYSTLLIGFVDDYYFKVKKTAKVLYSSSDK